MHYEAHETRRNDRVVNPDIPRSPELLQPAERGQVDMRVKLVSSLVNCCRRRDIESHGVEWTEQTSMTRGPLLNRKKSIMHE